ncbi:MAG TPA: phosphoribosyltransferase [Thermoplasmata archaeon]|nr:phosphoribosyltransferase [Thermoplasmata archaeon]
MAELPRCRRATWADVDRWADRVAEAIRARAAIPETIVGLTRGGWVPARLLCDRLGVTRMVSLRAQHWGITATPTGAAELTEGLSGPVRDQGVLVVDDITDTGESLRLAVDHVRAQGPRTLASATFLHISHARFVPDFYAEMIPRQAWAWIVFPWNYWEDLRTLAAKAAEIAPGLSAVQRTLRARCGLAVSRADLAEVARTVPLGTPSARAAAPPGRRRRSA